MTLDLVPAREGDTFVLAVTGELDNAVAYQLPDAVARGFEDEPAPTAVVVDLAGMSFCDSTGLGAMIRARQECEDRSAGFALRSVPPRTRELLAITGLDQDFEIG